MKLTNFNGRNIMFTYWENAVYQAPDKADGTKGTKHFYVDAMMDAKDIKEGEKQGSLHLGSRRVMGPDGKQLVDENGQPKWDNTVSYSESQVNKILDVAKASNNVQRVDYGDGKTKIVALVKADLFSPNSKTTHGVMLNTKKEIMPSDFKLEDATKRLQAQYDYMKDNAGAGKVEKAEKTNDGIPTTSAAEIPTVANEKTEAKTKVAKTTKAKASTGKARTSKAKAVDAPAPEIADGIDEPVPFG